MTKNQEKPKEYLCFPLSILHSPAVTLQPPLSSHQIMFGVLPTGSSPFTNEFFGPWVPFGCATLPQTLFPNSEVFRVLGDVKDRMSPCRLRGKIRLGRRRARNGWQDLGVMYNWCHSHVTLSAVRVHRYVFCGASLALRFLRCESSVTISAVRV